MPAPFRCFLVFTIVLCSLVIAGFVVFGITWAEKENAKIKSQLRPPSTMADDFGMAEMLTESTKFPDGSYKIDILSLKDGPSELKPVNCSQECLSLTGIEVDQTWRIGETGRLFFLFVALPSKVSAIGIQFGQSNFITAIPLSLAEHRKSGLSVASRRSEGTSIYQIEVEIAREACNGQSESACIMATFRPFSIIETNDTVASAGHPFKFWMACGPQCHDLSAPCAVGCADCMDSIFSRAITPSTRRLSLGRSSGKIRIHSKIQGQRDRITAISNGRVVFDSGCVRTNEWKLAVVEFSGSSELRFDIEPKCNREGAAFWHISPECLSQCFNFNDTKTVKITNQGRQIFEGSTVFILKDATFPRLRAEFCDTAAGRLSWKFTLTPLESTNKLCSTVIHTAQKDNIWNIGLLFRTVQGGFAEVSWSGEISGSLKFRIIGLQPSSEEVFVKVNLQTSLWYAKYVALFESNLRQFDSSGYPWISDTGGYGIFRLKEQTQYMACEHLWNWLSNVLLGIRELELHQGAANNWMVSQRQMAGNVKIPQRKEGCCLFGDGQPIRIEDAIALKTYGGQGCGNYCEWDRSKQAWNFNPTNCSGWNYVEMICQTVSLLKTGH